MDIGYAIEEMQRGLAVRRRGWRKGGLWIRLQMPDAESKMTLPYIYLRNGAGDYVPWITQHTDLLATDWEIVD
jgi:hypothetical protein